LTTDRNFMKQVDAPRAEIAEARGQIDLPAVDAGHGTAADGAARQRDLLVITDPYIGNGEAGRPGGKRRAGHDGKGQNSDLEGTGHNGTFAEDRR